MKNIKKIIATSTFIILTSLAFSQTAPPPNGGDIGEGGDTPVGGGAPIGSGIAFLVAMGSAYGGSKVFKAYKL
ncbi:MAG: hypothetical protein B7C24_15620 [Bacteroidetes bacterium 4572_77]|nr:MAG: hypothetical protein B7C24_15620 [Bacteroidetes bacterium 4572_77]